MGNRKWRRHELASTLGVKINNNVIPVYKPLGLTPLQTLQRLKLENPALHDEALAYAGRLDPMAEGLMIVLVGEECKKRDFYQKLPKSYEVTGIFGISTDTYDSMGLIQNVKKIKGERIFSKVASFFPQLIGERDQSYPPYSSVRVHGKPLFYWARKGLLDTIQLPSKKIDITSLEIKEKGELTADILLSQLKATILQVQGDFRQEEIVKKWSSSVGEDMIFPFMTFTIYSSQGAYMRSIIHEIGEMLGTGAIAYQIKRLSVGEYTADKALKI